MEVNRRKCFKIGRICGKRKFRLLEFKVYFEFDS